MINKTCGIYVIENTANGKKYVGQSDNVYRRKKQHFSSLRAGKHENWKLQQDYNTDRRHFRWRVLEWCDSKQLNIREKYWIDKLNTMAPYGYNLSWQPFTRHEQPPQQESKKASTKGAYTRLDDRSILDRLIEMQKQKQKKSSDSRFNSSAKEENN